jgi:Protein of unknown function (DUF3105)
MASRKEQKEAARARRIAEEQARRERVRRERRLRFAGGLVIVLVAAVAAAIAIGSSGGSKAGAFKPAPNGIKLPVPRITNLTRAAQAAGCVTINTPDSVARTSANRTHVAPGTKVPYATNPPTYGPHYPSPASDGEYKPSNTPAIGYLVHALEHGRVEYQYQAGLPTQDVKQLESLFNEVNGQWTPGQMLLLFQNPTHMPYAVAAVAWGKVLGCKTFTPKVFDALRDFRVAYTNQGPEQLGTAPE